MNKIFDNKQEFTELYRDAVMSISGKSVEAASDLDRFNALAKLVAEKARTVATKSDARVTAEGKKRVYYFSIEPPARQLPAQLWRARHGRRSARRHGF